MRGCNCTGFTLSESIILITCIGFFVAAIVISAIERGRQTEQKTVIELSPTGVTCTVNRSLVDCSSLEPISEEQLVYFPNGIKAN